uniref:translin-associated factor X-interacting protein 1 isoform X2 n=1 Tax=Pristiophorus japonicus TaxID=55135 RepID=UPI00398EF8D9
MLKCLPAIGGSRFSMTGTKVTRGPNRRGPSGVAMVTACTQQLVRRAEIQRLLSGLRALFALIMSTGVAGRLKTLAPNPRGASSKLNMTAPAPACLTYQLQGSNTRHHLPLKQLLPNVEMNGGYLTSWPGHISGEIVQHKRKLQSSNVDKHHGFDVIYTDNAPKPRFLEQLEAHLRKELEVLDLSGPNAQEVKLQAYREVFEYFIEDLKTYKLLLSAIKNEYEITLAHQRNRIRELEPLKSMLVATSENCEQRIVALQLEEKLEMKSLRRENKELLKKIDNLMVMQDSLKTQVSKLQEELAAEYERYRDQRDARKLLISDMNNLRYHQEESQDSHVYEAEAVEDTVKLKLALKVTRADLKVLQVELNAMKAEYGDVIPRRDFEALDKNYNELIEKNDILLKQFYQMKQEHSTLLEVNKLITLQRDKLNAEVELLKTKMAGDLSLNQISDIPIETDEDYFEGLSGTRSNLPEFFHKFLQTKYGDTALLWAYNLYYGCRNNQTDEFIGLFFSIINGIVDESVYHGQIQLISHLLKALTSRDNSGKGFLSKQEFSHTLKTALHNKIENDIQELISAATIQLGDGKKIQYKALFEENEGGKAGAFITLLQSQYAAEKNKYINELRNIVAEKEDLTVADLKKAFLKIDPSIDPQILATYLTQGFQTTKEQLDQTGAVDTDTVLDRLQASDVKRSGPRK